MTGRIIDADMDQRANIDRLTAQVARLTSDRDAAYRRIEADQKDINELASGFARLQESLTACEQERDDFKRIVEVWRKRHGGAEDRVRVLESALRLIRDDSARDISINPRMLFEHCNDALTFAPPTETPAPMIIGRTVISEPGAALTVTELHLSDEAKRALSTNGARIPTVARDASVDAPLWNHEQYDREIKTLNKALRSEVATVDRLRVELAAEKKLTADLRAGQQNDDRDHRELTAKLAAANEEIEHWKKASVDIADTAKVERDQRDREIERLHASMKLQRAATKQALDDRDATMAKLGRAVDANGDHRGAEGASRQGPPMKLSTLLKGLCIALLPGGVSILIAYWAMTRRKK